MGRPWPGESHFGVVAEWPAGMDSGELLPGWNSCPSPNRGEPQFFSSLQGEADETSTLARWNVPSLRHGCQLLGWLFVAGWAVNGAKC